MFHRALTLASVLSLAPLTLLPLAGCPVPPEVCTEEARASVSVNVLRADGALVPGVEVAFSVDGGASELCDDIGQGDFVCGWEIAGDFEIVASAPDHATDTRLVTVGEDECHVLTETLDIVLQEEVMMGRYEEPRSYFVQLIEDEEECANSWEEFGMNCFQSAWFCPDGSVQIVVTDILNAGTYGIGGGEVRIDLFAPGDLPADFGFAEAEGDTLVDTAGVVWRRDLDGSRVGLPICGIDALRAP